MRVLLTGGAGFIGSHVAERLLARGHEIVVVDDDLSSGKRESVPEGARFCEQDIRTDCEDIFREFRPEAFATRPLRWMSAAQCRSRTSMLISTS
jgi:UDP-glucose 4-epimerase